MNNDLVVNKTNSISYFNYLLKWNLLSVFKGEDLNSVTLDYKLIFIFNDIKVIKNMRNKIKSTEYIIYL